MNLVNHIEKDSGLSDLEFCQQFEDKTLNVQHFNHLGHLRIAWFYLHQYPLSIAVNKTCAGIKAYAESLGAHDKFNHTLTEALVRIMATRLNKISPSNWQGFVIENRDLVMDAKQVLRQYYSIEQLFSVKAACTFVEPDLKPLPSAF